MSRTHSPTAGWRTRLISALLAACLGIVFFIPPLGDFLTGWSYDLLFPLRKTIPVDEVTLVYLDPESHQKFGQARFGQAWDRRLHAQLIDRLKELGAKTVMMDILFPGPSDPAADQQLVEAAVRHGNVVVAAKAGFEFHEGDVIGVQLIKPFTNLASRVAWGLVEESLSQRIIRRHNSAAYFEIPSLAWRAAELSVSNLPPDPFLERWMNYSGPPGSLRYFRFHEVLDRSAPVPTEAFSNKVVVVGAQYSTAFTGGKGTDDFDTPYTLSTRRKSPGAEINATAYLNIIRRDWLRRLPRTTEALILFASGILSGFALLRFRPWVSLSVAFIASAVVAFAAYAITWSSLYWFPWLCIAAVQIPVAAIFAFVWHTRALHSQKQNLEIQLAAAQVALRSSDSAQPKAAEYYFPPTRPTASASEPAGANAALAAAPPVPDHQLLKCIGRGAYGEVWLARDAIGTFHAVKIVYRARLPDAGPFEREFRGLQKFTPISRSHPAFVNILHVGRNDDAGYFYAIMEIGDDVNSGQKIHPERYAPRTLASEIARRGRLPASEVTEVALHLGAALEHLHRQQLVHRDIKPSNIIFVNGIPKFADIGLVTDLRGGAKDATYLGTAGYIPPEGPGTAAADIYGLGKVLYELATGLDRERFPELPTILTTGHEDTLHIFFELNRVILKACETEVKKRYASAAALCEDLHTLQPPSKKL